MSALTAIHLNDDSQFKQFQGNFVSKIEFNSVLSDAMFLEVRGGQWGYRRDFTNETTAPSYEDPTTRIVSGAAQNRYDRPRRNQVNGSLSYYKEGFGGTHNGEVRVGSLPGDEHRGVLHEQTYNDVVHILRSGAPLEVFLLGNPAEFHEAWNTGLYLTDTWRVSDKLTLNLGVRFNRSKNFLSEQMHQADRFFPETVVFPAVDNVRNWNLVAPRLGVSYNLTGDGRYRS